MKYENFKQVKEIVEKIQSLENDLYEMNRYNVQVQVVNNNCTIFRINVEAASEHTYADAARKLCEEIRNDLQRRIDNNKAILEEL